jgi:hypothetical protein
MHVVLMMKKYRLDTKTWNAAASSPRMGLVEETIKPIELLVPVSFMGRPTSTPGLSTWWSTTALSEALF